MTVNVFVWLPKGEDVGHTALGIDGNFYISFWPNKANKSFAGSIVRSLNINVARAPLYQDYDFDLNKLGFEPIVIDIEGLNEEKIREYWLKIKESELDWKLAEFNCATMIANCLYLGSSFEPSFSPLASLDLYIGLGLPLGEVEAWEPKTILRYAKEIQKFKFENK
jgi:hypothetical protein